MDRETYSSTRQLQLWLHLLHCRRLSSQAALKLVSISGSAEAVLTASTSRLREITGNRNISSRLLADHDAEGVQRDLTWLRRCEHHHILPWSDRRYPGLLREIPDAPLLLYVSGDHEALDSRQLAIVGSRNPTPAGRSAASRLARNLSLAGLTITSGLATGIDASAHEGALSAGRPTVAVMATGPDCIYPARHRQLARTIEASGALVTERPVGTHPTRQAFPQRNRIISGLSIGTLVVEATERSGSLITARFAGEQGRDVYAIPGSILSPLSRGCHALIRDGAGLVESESDILDEIGHQVPPQRESGPTPELNDEAGILISAMGFDPIAVDTMIQRSGLTADKVCAILLRLEMQGLVKSVTGGHYMRVG